MTTTVPVTTTTTLSVEEATAAFQSCLINNGVTITEIPFDSQGRPRLELAMTGVDFDDPRAVEALTSCSGLLAQGALDLSAWPSLRVMVQEALVDFAECVRMQGVVDFPDPVRDFSGVGGPFLLDEIPYDDPDLEAAVARCRLLMVGSG